MKTLLLAGALLLAPMQAEETVATEETQETVATEETQETELLEKAIKALEEVEWFKTLISSLGIGVGTISVGTILSLIVVAFRSLANSLKLKKSERETLASVKESVLKEIDTSVDRQVKEKIEPVLENVVKTLDNTKDLQAVLTKIVALSQSDSVESKLAILECIASLGVIDKTVIEDKKEEIIKEDELATQEIENAKTELDKVIEETNIVL